jgi:hypothetical protein
MIVLGGKFPLLLSDLVSLYARQPRFLLIKILSSAASRTERKSSLGTTSVLRKSRESARSVLISRL